MTTTAIERPIIFSGPMILALLAGLKTQTRRVVKPAAYGKKPESFGVGTSAAWDCQRQKWIIGDTDLYEASERAKGRLPNFGSGAFIQHFRQKCPYGNPGDRLWVREAWSPDHARFYPNFPNVYQADGTGPKVDGHGDLRRVWSPEHKQYFAFHWRSPIHMPRSASRITLEIESIRIEQLQSITEADAIAEGFSASKQSSGISARESFAITWDRINGKKCDWVSNPWVWALTFRLLETSR